MGQPGLRGSRPASTPPSTPRLSAIRAPLGYAAVDLDPTLRERDHSFDVRRDSGPAYFWPQSQLVLPGSSSSSSSSNRQLRLAPELFKLSRLIGPGTRRAPGSPHQPARGASRQARTSCPSHHRGGCTPAASCPPERGRGSGCPHPLPLHSYTPF